MEQRGGPGRRERPLDPGAGSLQRFAHELRQVRQEAGGITYREMAGRCEFSTSTLSQAAGGERLPSLPVTLAYVRACGGDAQEWEERWRGVADEVTAQVSDEDEATAPYRGLARFEPGDRGRFFGRDQLTEDLVQLVREHRLVTLFGPSGSGKSSLLRAGLIPRLQHVAQEELRPAAIRILTPGARPSRTLEQILAPAGAEGDTWLIVDQFEEVFTLCQDPDERDQVIDRLLLARDPANRLRVVLGVRADFYSHCLAHRRLAEAVRDASLPVVPMSPEELREAIVKPATDRRLTVERALTSRLVDETVDEPGGLPLMSHALLETWRRRRGPVLTLAAYEAAGGVTGSVSRTAEDLYTQLAPEHADLARRILLRLITPGNGVPDTRRPIQRAELDTGDEADTSYVLDRLARARLVTLDQDSVDLAHEAVITGWPRLRGWIDEDRERLRVHRRLTEAATTWAELNRDLGALYRGARLSVAQEYFPRPHQHKDLTELERDFLTASTAAREQERQAAVRATRRLRRFAAGLSVLLVLAVTAGVIAWQQSLSSDRERNRAVTAQHTAQSRQLAAESTTLLGSDSDVAALLAVQAHRTAPTTEATASLYAAAALPLKRRFTGHTDQVFAVVFSPDGKTLATGGNDKTVRLWDVATGKARSTLTGHTQEVRRVAFSPDGKSLATSSLDKTVRLWDVATGKRRATFTGHTDAVFGVAFSPDGKSLATSSDDKTARLWNVATGKARATLTGHTNTVSAVAFSPDGKSLATSSLDKTVRLWDAATGTARATLTGHTQQVYEVVFSPDGKTLATGSGENDARLWDIATGKARAILTGHAGEIYAVAFSPDGKTLATGGADETLRLWDVATGKTRTTLTGHTQEIRGLAFSPDGKTVASSGDTTARLWDIVTGKTRTTLTGHTDEVNEVAFGPDGKTVAAASVDETARLWDATTGKPRATFTGHEGAVYSVAFSPNGKTLATGGVDGTARLWDVATGKPRATFTGHAGAVDAVAFSPDGKTLATGGIDKTARLWDIATGKPRTTLTGHTDEVFAVAFSPNGKTLATGSTDGTARLWDVATAKPRTTLAGHTNKVTGVAFSPDGKTLATVSPDTTARLWNVATGKTQATLTGHTNEVYGVAFSPDGKTLATVSADKTARLWDVATAKPRTTLTGHTGEVTRVAFSPDGKTLATGSTDTTVRLWEVELLTPTESVSKICNAVHRDLTRQERATYLPDQPHRPVCPS